MLNWPPARRAYAPSWVIPVDCARICYKIPIDPIWELYYYVSNMETGVMEMQNNIKISDDFQEIGTKTMDDRNRLTLGEIFKGYKRIRLYKNDRGEVLLQPIVEIPASEVWLFQNSKALESVQKGLRDASEGKITKLNLNEL